MKVTRVGKRGHILTNEKGTSVYLINTEYKLFLCDTQEGPQYMKEVEAYILKNGWQDKPMVIFLSHADYDHIWGNSYFKDALIIASDKCVKRMKERALFDYETYDQHHHYQFELRFPSISFHERLEFLEDGIEFFVAPGHTVDSTVCCDKKDQVLFVGDLLEAPIPYLQHHVLSDYLLSLQKIKTYEGYQLVIGHSDLVASSLIDGNIRYLTDVLLGNEMDYVSDDYKPLHEYNLKSILLDRYDSYARKNLNPFHFYEYRHDLWRCLKNLYSLESDKFDLKLLSYEQLEKGLLHYFKNDIKLV